MKAPAADQQRLLVVQQHDSALQRLAARKAGLPELAQLDTVGKAEQVAGEDLATAQAVVHDIERELTKLEDDVTKVETRRERDKQRLDSGHGQSRELVALQQEIEALNRRQSELEDLQLDVMERLEAARGTVAGLRSGLGELAFKRGELEQAIADQVAAIEAEEATEATARAEAAAGLDEGLTTLYERLRAKLGGVGAAGLVQRRCEGCRMELNPADLDAIRHAEPDVVVRCEECGRILVRGEDSGL
ncbi:MAG: C4-type zinc ribbon domain-containing protein [Bifidobacteriaceae bacterium]|nr:C4-type zinc ribbon domain-containing protein [Bifidobacteriaceae bacterium]